MTPQTPTLMDRELSWLSFSHRVLQEAEDPTVPLLERLFFCGIFSSNLDEYFRVRVASLRSLLRLKPEARNRLGVNPHRLLHDIHRIVVQQQDRYGDLLGRLMGGLRREGIHLVSDTTLPPDQEPWVRDWFRETVAPRLAPVLLRPGGESPPFLTNRRVYLVVELWDRDAELIDSWRPDYALVELPSPPLDRFVVLPQAPEPTVMYLDDVVRLGLDDLFPTHEVGRAYAVKLTRDADLRLEDEFEGDLVEAIRSSLGRRETGVPSRFLYDMRTPYVLIHTLQHELGLSDQDLVVGGRYHNLHDLMAFPRFQREDLSYPAWPPAPHPVLDEAPSILAAVAEKDRVLHTPYQSFGHIVRFLREAATDPEVEEIWLTVYRVARDSAVLHALLEAAEAGKRVTVFMEVQARFDEESNLEWADRMEAAGVRTLYSIPGLKVHAKIALVVRREAGGMKRYGYVGTGNFNEKTAGTYADHGVFTCHPGVTGDLRQVFAFLAGEVEEPELEHLLVAPFNLRQGFYRLLDAEAEAARAGRPSGVTLKMNALQDRAMVGKVYETSRAGVPIRAVVRGICCAVPGVPGQSETLEARSIVDRLLEHARLYRFHAGGAETLFLASADWMTRNLSRRVEVALPVYDPDVKRELETLLEIQLADDTKARILDAEQTNPYVPPDPPRVRAQEAFREYVAGLAREAL